MFVPPSRRLLYGDPVSAARALVSFAAERAAHDEPSTRMLALCSGHQAARHLRNALEDAGGVPTADVWRRAVALLEQFPEVAGLATDWQRTAIISAHDRRFLVGRAWAQAGQHPDSLYHRYGDAVGAVDWVARVFDRFAAWCGTADPRRLDHAPRDAVLGEMWAAYRAYLQAGQEHGVVAFQEVMPRALDALRDPDVRARVQPELLLLDALDLFRPPERLFATALIGPRTTVVATATRPPRADDPDPTVRSLARWCAENAVEVVALPPDPALPVPSATLRAHDTFDGEVVALVREIANAINEGVAPEECAVVLFDDEMDAPLRRACAAHGLAVEGGERRDAFTLSQAALIVGGMRLIAADPCAPADLLAMVRHPLLGFPSADLHLCTALVDTLAAPNSARDGDPLTTVRQLWTPASSPEGLEQVQHFVRVTASIRRQGAPPSAKLRRWLAELGIDRRAAEWTQRILEPWAAAADATLLDRWFTFLEQSERLRDALGVPLADREAVEVLRASRALVEPVIRQREHAVQYWTPEHLGGHTARQVWLAGVHERSLPRPVAALPWASWAAYEEAFGVLPGFAAADPDDRAARWAEGEHLLRRAVACARESATLSWSALGRDGRRRLPSPLLNSMTAQSAPLFLAEHVDAAPSVVDVFPAGTTLLPSEAGPEVFTTSPSAIENYLRCPRQYFYARQLHLFDVVSTPRQAFGQVVHAALREMEQHDERDIETLLDLHWSSTEGRFGTRLRAAAFRNMARDALRQVAAFDRERREAGWRFVAAEARLCWRVTPDVELRGTIDRIDRGPDGLSVIDYKLGAESPSINALLQMFVEPPEPQAGAIWRPTDLQLPLYALAIQAGAVEQHPELAREPIAEIGLVYPLQLYSASGKASTAGRRMIRIREHTSSGCPVCTAPRGRSPSVGELCRAQLDAALNQAFAVVAAMRSGMIDPVPVDGADTCRACAFRTICPAPQA